MPELTAEEQAHQKSLETLLEALRATSADPATSIPARLALAPRITELEDQLDDVEAGVFSRATHTIQAQEQIMAPALEELQDLKKELQKIAGGIKDVATITDYVDQAIVTCTSLM